MPFSRALKHNTICLTLSPLTERVITTAYFSFQFIVYAGLQYAMNACLHTLEYGIWIREHLAVISNTSSNRTILIEVFSLTRVKVRYCLDLKGRILTYITEINVQALFLSPWVLSNNGNQTVRFEPFPKTFTDLIWMLLECFIDYKPGIEIRTTTSLYTIVNNKRVCVNIQTYGYAIYVHGAAHTCVYKYIQ